MRLKLVFNWLIIESLIWLKNVFARSSSRVFHWKFAIPETAFRRETIRITLLIELSKTPKVKFFLPVVDWSVVPLRLLDSEIKKKQRKSSSHDVS